LHYVSYRKRVGAGAEAGAESFSPTGAVVLLIFVGQNPCFRSNLGIPKNTSPVKVSKHSIVGPYVGNQAKNVHTTDGLCQKGQRLIYEMPRIVKVLLKLLI
jgi:hypothetical protein